MYTGAYFSFGDANSSRYYEYSMGFDFRPINALSLSFKPTYSIQNDPLQYVEMTDTENDKMYLFAQLDRKTLSFTFRLNLTLNPELSLEYYGQPYISAGEYKSFKKITSPRADEFTDRFYVFSNDEIVYNTDDNNYTLAEIINNMDDYSFDNPDFNFRQFHSNLVIRWEYRPGSTLFLVWSQGRTSRTSDGLFSYGSDMSELFGVTPHNVFLVKFSYWLSL